MSQQPNIPLPAGLTPDMMAAIAQYFAAQQVLARTAPRPSGLLQPSQIRGVDLGTPYVYREFPKALNPPADTINSSVEERNWRAKHKQPLPWDDRLMVDTYYQTRSYPVSMKPPQIVVHTAQDEKAKLAEWNMSGGDRISYPRYLFHPAMGAKFVNSIDEEQALGDGWFGTPSEAMDEALRLAKGDNTRDERHALITEAMTLGVKFEQSWNNKRVREAIDKFKAAAETKPVETKPPDKPGK